MKLISIAALLVAIAFLAVLILTKSNRKSRRASGDLRPKKPLSDREQSMYFRLRDSLPNRIVLAQVAFSALLETKDRPTRATFDRKVADFVICSTAFEVIAVVELDDASHRGNEAKDTKRDGLLTAAGIKVVRFKNVPNQSEVLAELDDKKLTRTT
jgi:very-short-patch-repair endonuclease